MACVSTKDKVSFRKQVLAWTENWNNTNQDLSKFTSSDLSREAEQINHGFLAVTVSKGLTSQQSQPTLHHVKPSCSTRLQRHPTSSTESTNDSWNYPGGNKKHFFKTKEQNKTNKRKSWKKKEPSNQTTVATTKQWVFLTGSLGESNLVSGLSEEK